MLSCIVCDKELQPAFPGDDEEKTRQCDDAVMFSSGGNYGSRVWDPMSGRRELLINVCDECLTRKSGQVTLVKVFRPVPEVTYTPWNPEEPEN